LAKSFNRNHQKGAQVYDHLLSKACKIGNSYQLYEQGRTKTKRQSLTIIVVLLATLALAGCGVSAEDYDKAVSDLAAAQTQIQNLESELASAQSENSRLEEEKSSLQSDLDTAITAYQDLEAEYDYCSAVLEEGAAEYDDLNAMLEKVASDIDSAYVYHSIVIELLGPAVTGDALNAPETIATVGYLVDEAGDEGLQERFDAWSASTWNRALAYQLLWYAQVKLEEMVFELGD